jgi:hypothetical protein
MKKYAETIFAGSFLLFCFFLLLFMGSEPTNFTEEGLANYESSVAAVQPFFMITLSVLLLTTIVSGILSSKYSK